MECGKVVKESVIPKGNGTTIDKVQNVYTIHRVPDPNLKKSGKKKKRGISDDEKIF